MEEFGDFRCAHCEAQFSTWQALDDHRRTAHLVDEPSPLRCPTCGEPFGSRPALELHQREAHDVPTPEDWEIPVVAAEDC